MTPSMNLFLSYVVCIAIFGIPNNTFQNKSIWDNIIIQLAECLKHSEPGMHVNPLHNCFPA